MKMFLRTLVFLALLLAVLYVGMNNAHQIDFFFPVLVKGKIHATAAILYFAMFAVGVLAGIALGAGRRSRTGGSDGKRKG
jgi:uncharacterized membrane protein YciS (DUF1049 family)